MFLVGLIIGMIITCIFAVNRINELEKEKSKEKRRADNNLNAIKDYKEILKNADNRKENYYITFEKLKRVAYTHEIN